MTTSQLEEGDFAPLDRDAFAAHSTSLSEPACDAFKEMLKGYAVFQGGFALLGIIELCFIILFSPFLARTSLLAISTALLFLTIFSYLILRIYLNTKKPQQFEELRDSFLDACKASMHYQEGVASHHLALANALSVCSSSLEKLEWKMHIPKGSLASFAPLAAKISCLMHWKDVHRMRDLLLMAAIEEHIALIKFEPTNLEAHASLANTYILLSTLYNTKPTGDWAPPGRCTEEMHEKFVASAERAMEEFKVLRDYAPNDPWVHTQLALSYRDLHMAEEEIKEYETILKLCPDDKETLFKLGVLYFEQGYNAKGLQIYEELKRVHYKRAEELITYYGSYTKAVLV